MIAQSTPSIQPSRQHSYLCSNIDVSWPTFCNHDRNCSYPSQRYFQSPDRFRQYIRSEYTRPGSSCNDVTSPLSDISHGMAAEHRRPTQRPPLFTHHGICFSTYDHRILRTSSLVPPVKTRGAGLRLINCCSFPVTLFSRRDSVVAPLLLQP
jgi:hypothetical protein